MLVVKATKTKQGGTSLTVVPHVCKICNKAFLQESSLLDHLQSHEESLTVIINLTENTTSVNVSDNDVKEESFQDKICDETSITPSKTEVLEEEKEKNPHFCNLCKRSFSSKSYLFKHMKLHIGDRPHRCDICHKSFVLKDNLVKHYITHDPDKKRFFCLECGKGFTSRQYKEKHELIHLGEKPHVCTICEKAFTLKTNLNKHVLTHSENRLQYMCDVCGKGFASKSYLEKHHLIHVGEKPHVCGYCHRAFTLKTNLHKHYVIHTGYRRFGCEMCFKLFKTKGALISHYGVHSGEKPFRCQKCLCCFKKKGHLARHMLIHSPKELCKEPSDIISINANSIGVHEVVIEAQDGTKENNQSDDDKSFLRVKLGNKKKKKKTLSNAVTDTNDSCVKNECDTKLCESTKGRKKHKKNTSTQIVEKN